MNTLFSTWRRADAALVAVWIAPFALACALLLSTLPDPTNSLSMEVAFAALSIPAF